MKLKKIKLLAHSAFLITPFFGIFLISSCSSFQQDNNNSEFDNPHDNDYSEDNFSNEQIKKLYELFKDTTTLDSSVDPNTITSDANLNLVYKMPNIPYADIKVEYNDFFVIISESSNNLSLSFSVQLIDTKNGTKLGDHKTITITGFKKVPIIETNNKLNDLINLINNQFSKIQIAISDISMQNIPESLTIQSLKEILKNSTNADAKKLFDTLNIAQSEFKIIVVEPHIDYKKGIFKFKLQIIDETKNAIQFAYSEQIELIGFNIPNTPFNNIEEIINTINSINTVVPVQNNSEVNQLNISSEPIFNNEIETIFKNSTDANAKKLFSIISNPSNKAFLNFSLIPITNNYDLGTATVLFKIYDSARKITKYSHYIKLNNFTKLNNQTNTPLKAKDIKQWINDLVNNNAKTKYFELVNGASWIRPEEIKSFYQLSFYLQKEFIFILNNYFNINFESAPKIDSINGCLEVKLKITNKYNKNDIATTALIKFTGMKKQLDNNLNSAKKIAFAINSLPSEAFIVNADGKQRPNDIFLEFYLVKNYLTNLFTSKIPPNYKIEFDTNKGGILTQNDGQFQAYLKIVNNSNYQDIYTTNQLTFTGFEKFRGYRPNIVSFEMSEIKKLVGNAGEKYNLVGAENILNTTIFSYSDLEKYLQEDFKKLLTTKYNADFQISGTIATEAEIIGAIDYSNDNAVSLYLRIRNKANPKDVFVTNKLTFTGFKSYKQDIRINPIADVALVKNLAIPNFAILNPSQLKKFLLEDKNSLVDKLWSFIKVSNVVNSLGNNNFYLTKNDIIINFNSIVTPPAPDQSILAFSISLSISGQQRFFINEENTATIFIVNLKQNIYQNYNLKEMANLIKQKTNSSETLILTIDKNFDYNSKLKFNDLIDHFQNVEKNLFRAIQNSNFFIEFAPNSQSFDSNLGILNTDLILSKKGLQQKILLKNFNFRGFTNHRETIVFKNRHDDTLGKDVVFELTESDLEKKVSAKEFYDVFNMPYKKVLSDNPYDIKYLNHFIQREFLLKYIVSTIKSKNKVALEADDIKITKLLLKEKTNSLGFWFTLSSQGQEKFDCITIDGLRNDEELNYLTKKPPLGNYIEIKGFNTYGANESLSKIEASELVIKYQGKIPASALMKFKYIEASAFAKNNDLISIEIPENILNIGVSAFSECANLVSATLPNSLYMIPDGLFWKADSLSKVNIPKNIVLIGQGAFGSERVENKDYQATIIGPDLAQEIIIPDSVKFIKSWAFSFSKTTSFRAGKNLLYIGWGAFVASANNSSIILNDKIKRIDNNAFQENLENKAIVFPDSLEYIGAYSFFAHKIEKLIIPEKVRIIRGSSFAANLLLNSVEIGNSVDEIGDNAFNACIALKNISIPDSVETIGSGAFYGSGLEHIDLGKVSLIGPSAFEGVKLQELFIPSSVKLIDIRAFANNGGSIKKLVFESTINQNFNDVNNNGNRYFANQLENIATLAFSNSLGISELDIPANVVKIGEAAFSNNPTINKIRFLDSIGIAFQGFSIIKQQAFSGLENLVSIEMPNIYQNRNINIGLTKEQENMIRWY